MADDIDKAVRDLRSSERQLRVEQRKVWMGLSTKGAGWVRGGARTAQERRFASAVQGRPTATQARLAVIAKGRNAGANVPFYGMARRAGWNAKNRGSRPQGPRPVGNNWIPGQRGEGPYVFRDVIPAHMTEIERDIEDAVWRALSIAGG